MASKVLQDRPKTAPRRPWRVIFVMSKIVLIFDAFWVRFWTILAPKMPPFWHPLGDQNRSKMPTPLAVNLGSPTCPPKTSQDRTKTALRSPKARQDRPKTAPRPPQDGQDPPKIATRSAKTPPRASQELPKALKTAPRHPKMHPRGPTYSQERPKTAPQAPGNGIARRASSSAVDEG